MSNQQPSLADSAVQTLADIRAIGAGMSSEHPMRHSARTLQHTAERILSDAFYQASNIAQQAKQILSDHDEAVLKLKNSVK